MTEQDQRGYLSPVLEELAKQVTYKPGWMCYITHEIGDDGSGGWKLCIVSDTEDSMNRGHRRRTRFEFLIPAASYNRNNWAVWLFERHVDVERHEAGEFFQINGVREFAPHHGNGEDPHITWHMSDYATANKGPGDD